MVLKKTGGICVDLKKISRFMRVLLLSRLSAAYVTGSVVVLGG